MIVKSSDTERLNFEGLPLIDYTSHQDSVSSFAKLEVASGSKHRIAWSRKSEKFYYVLKGQLVFMMDNKEYVANSGDLCIIPARTKFAYMNRSDGTAEVVLIHSPKIDMVNEVFEGDYF